MDTDSLLFLYISEISWSLSIVTKYPVTKFRDFEFCVEIGLLWSPALFIRTLLSPVTMITLHYSCQPISRANLELKFLYRIVFTFLLIVLE